MRRTGGGMKVSGWHRLGSLQKGGDMRELPVVPAAWEEQLRARGLSERQALAAVKAGIGDGVGLREWVKRNCRQRFVPERVLKAIGISSADVVAERYCSEETREKLSTISRRGWAMRG